MLATSATELVGPEKIIAQIVKFECSKTIDKVSLDFSVTKRDVTTFIVGSDGAVSFQASNFQHSRHDWVFQPAIHWASSSSWDSSGTSVQNTFQSETYDSDYAIVNSSPYLKYDFYVDREGVYDLWGYGYTNGNIYWGLDDDETDLRSFTLGTSSGPPQWTKFGSVYCSEGGLHSFTIYLGTASLVVLDQWYFTDNRNFEQNLTYTNSEFTSLALSECPFNTIVRLRTLDGNNLDSLESPSSGNISVSSWLSSITILDSGSFNYKIQDISARSGVLFDNGLSIECWQVGGSINHCVAWNFIIDPDSTERAYQSNNYGQTFNEL